MAFKDAKPFKKGSKPNPFDKGADKAEEPKGGFKKAQKNAKKKCGKH